MKSHLGVRRPFTRFERGEISELGPLRIVQAEDPKPAVRPADDPNPPPTPSRGSFHSPTVLQKEVGITGYHRDQPRMRSGSIIPPSTGDDIERHCMWAETKPGSLHQDRLGRPSRRRPSPCLSLGRSVRPREYSRLGQSAEIAGGRRILRYRRKQNARRWRE